MHEIIYVEPVAHQRRRLFSGHRASGIQTPLRVFAGASTFLAYLNCLDAADRRIRIVLLSLDGFDDDTRQLLAQMGSRTGRERLLIWMLSDGNLPATDPNGAAPVRILNRPGDTDSAIELFREIGGLLEPRTDTVQPATLPPLSILLVEDNLADATLLQEGFRAIHPSLQLVHVASLREAHVRLNQQAFDGVLLDLNLPDAQEMVGLVSITAAWPLLPVVIVSGLYDEQRGRLAIRSGAQDFVSKQQLQLDTLQLLLMFAIERQSILNSTRREAARNLDSSLTDALTGLPNRRALIEAYRQLPANIDPASNHINAIVVLDIDGLKAVNDALGHAAGDQLILSVATAIRDRLRPSDTFGRIGGDEFVILLDDVDGNSGVSQFVDRIQAGVAALPPGLQSHAPTGASFGYALIPRGGASFDQVFAVADEMMYRNKQQRRP